MYYIGDNKLQPVLVAVKQSNYVAYPDFYKKDGFLLKGVQLCVPKCSLGDQLLLEVHNLGLFGRDKTLTTTEIQLKRHGSRCVKAGPEMFDLSEIQGGNQQCWPLSSSTCAFQAMGVH